MSYTALLVVSSVWLLLLTLGLLIVRRELSILQDRVAVSGAAPADGLAVGALAPPFPGLRPDDVVLFFFGDCEPCHEVATQVAGSAEPGAFACVVSDGTMAGSSAGFARILPDDARVLTGDEAGAVRERYKVHSGPFGVAVSNGLVVAKGVLRSADDLEHLHRAAYGAASVGT
ncbi:hypothetical protein [Nonomuraea basaltis]|uniref:hypothetical protein n=1 Tax=Nonomuraea basaltis TaxID=2495887 RepID=UPI00110C46B6|nr:hypothetical protein [Nonomuraea basaltis]TMR93145.1 hypothetical protein EJK15_40845 [Nonomuraea basaltis]